MRKSNIALILVLLVLLAWNLPYLAQAVDTTNVGKVKIWDGTTTATVFTGTNKALAVRGTDGTNSASYLSGGQGKVALYDSAGNGSIIAIPADGSPALSGYLATAGLLVTADGTGGATQHSVAKDWGIGNGVSNATKRGVLATAIYGQFNTTLPTLATGLSSILQTDNNGRLFVVPGAGATFPVSGTVTANQGTGGSSVWLMKLSQTTTDNDVDVTSIAPGNNNIGDVDVLTLPAATVAGTTAVLLDYDTGAGTQNMLLNGIALPASGGSVAGGTSTNPLRIDPTGTTTQPVSGTVTANAGTGTLTSRSGTITTGGTSQQLMGSNATRQYLACQNLSTGNLFIRPGATAAVQDQPSFKITPDSMFFMESSFLTTEAWQIIGATTGQAFSCYEK